jgi:four helix bundle protein
MSSRRNVNRGYRQLRVWEDASLYYAITCRVFRKFPHMLQRVASNQIASVDSVHRNIAEGYCRRSVNEYLQFLNYALASTGESVSGLHVYREAKQISEGDFEEADTIAYRLENGLKRLIASLQAKRNSKDWEDSFIVEEPNVTYDLGAQGT